MQPKQPFSASERLALMVGVLVVAGAALITTRLRPFPLPISFVLSLVLGGAAFIGALKVLDPRTPQEVLEHRAAAEFRSLLGEMKVIAARTWAAGQQPWLNQPTASQLRAISSALEAIVKRYQARSPDLAGASATVTVLKQFDRVLAYYLKLKSGKQFVNAAARDREIAETEGQTIPMVQAALQTLGQQLDAGEVVDKQVWEGTLMSLLRSLHLIKAPVSPVPPEDYAAGSPVGKEGPK